MKGIYIDERYWEIVGGNNATAVFVYAVIAYATKKGGYDGGQERLAEVCHVPKTTLRRILAQMKEKGIITDHYQDGVKIYRTSVQNGQSRVSKMDTESVQNGQSRVSKMDTDTLYKNINKKRGKKEESPKDGGDFISFAAVVMEDFKKWFEYVKGVPFSNNSDTLTECREIAGQIAQLMRAQNLNADNVEEFRAFFRKWIKAAYEVCDRWQKDNFSLTTLKRQFNQLTAKINGNTLNNDELAAALADIKQAQRIIAQNRQAGNA